MSQDEIKEQQQDNIENFNVQSALVPGERIEWEMDFKEGIIHRHPRSTTLITNARVIFIDRLNAKVTQSLLIKDTDMAIMNRHTLSNSTGGGFYHGGMYSSNRVGSSKTVGTLVFMVNGVTRITLGRVGDPQGVKNLFTAIKKQIAKSLPKSPTLSTAKTISVAQTRPPELITPPNKNDVKYCSNCGTELSLDSRFCNKCGRAQP